MNKNGTSKAGYRLAARMCGDKLTIDSRLCEELRADHERAIRSSGSDLRDPDDRAFARSVEWQRFGDFLAAVGRGPDAVRAYRQAILCCLDGTYYDHGQDHFPSRWLRMRFFKVFGIAVARFGNDARLKNLICGDTFIRKEYVRFAAYNRF